VCLKRKVAWPLSYPSPQNISPDNQDYGFFLEIHSVLATALGWGALQEFIIAATGKKEVTVDWTTSYRIALALVHHALGLKEGDAEGPIPDRLKTLEKWSIDRVKIVTQEEWKMAKKKGTAKEVPAAESMGTKTGRFNDKEKNKSTTPKEKGAVTGVGKVPKEKSKALPEGTRGGLEFAAAFLPSLADYAGQAAEEAPGDERLSKLAELLSEAADLLDKVTG
jgi:hypothetical protein